MELKLRELRHELRGQANALVLSAAAVSLAENKRETLEFIEGVERAAEAITALLDRLEVMPEHYAAEGSPQRSDGPVTDKSAGGSDRAGR